MLCNRFFITHYDFWLNYSKKLKIGSLLATKQGNMKKHIAIGTIL